MLNGIILVEGTILNKMVLISTFVTSAALNGLNVTVGYCVRLGFKVQSPDLLMMASIKFEARIMLAGPVGVRLYACSTTSEHFEMYSCMAKSVCLNVVYLCLAIVEFTHSENLSCKRGYCRPMFT